MWGDALFFVALMTLHCLYISKRARLPEVREDS